MVWGVVPGVLSKSGVPNVPKAVYPKYRNLEDPDGWVNLTVVLECPRMKRLGADESQILWVASSSTELEE